MEELEIGSPNTGTRYTLNAVAHLFLFRAGFDQMTALHEHLANWRLVA